MPNLSIKLDLLDALRVVSLSHLMNMVLAPNLNGGRREAGRRRVRWFRYHFISCFARCSPDR
jgi:hypothetical protein